MNDKLDKKIKSVRWLSRLFLTKDGKAVIGQFPNAPLIVALLADGVSYVAHGAVQTVSTRVAQGAFAIWAVMEIGWGVNPFRRILGWVVLALEALACFKSFH